MTTYCEDCGIPLYYHVGKCPRCDRTYTISATPQKPQEVARTGLNCGVGGRFWCGEQESPGESRRADSYARLMARAERAEKEREMLKVTLASLAEKEASYRKAYERYGHPDVLNTGRAWDLMRRAGDKARTLLKELEG